MAPVDARLVSSSARTSACTCAAPYPAGILDKMTYPFPLDALGRYLVPVPIIVVDYAENARNHGQRPEHGYPGVAELAAEFKRGGEMIHAVTLAEDPLDQRLHLAAGFRRYDAATLAGWESLPAQIKPMDRGERRAFNLRENRNRKDTSSYDVALGFARLRKEQRKSVAEIAAATGYTVAYVGELLSQLRELHPTLLNLWRMNDARLRTHTRRQLVRMKLPAEQQLDHFGLGAKKLQQRTPSVRRHPPARAQVKAILDQLGHAQNRMSHKRRFATTLLRWFLWGEHEERVLAELGLKPSLKQRPRNQV